jgi:3-hydroxybutyryl-CoA dehydrogenase
MRCFVLSDDDHWKELFASSLAVEVIRVSRNECIPGNADVLFDLRYEAWDMALYKAFPQNPIFISAVQGTLSQHQAPDHVVRLNGWAGMMDKPLLECSGHPSIRPRAEDIIDRLNKKVEWVPDLAGMVSPRVISMIINEAWYTWEEGVASKDDIDTAMKLGTNYPFGPFAWGELIGLKKIVSLLHSLAPANPRYQVAGSLAKEAIT